jgi:RNA polymerase sigma-70 factor (ECF subfamily)
MGAALDAYDQPCLSAMTIDPELAAIRSGDEQAFEDLVHRHYPAMLRIAMSQVRDRTVAEDVVQETWITFLRNLDRFEGRSSLRTWIMGILLNVARARRRQEARLQSFTTMLDRLPEGRRPTVDRHRFTADGTWRSGPPTWSDLPEAALESRETLAVVQAAMEMLPTNLRQVIVLRDVAGWSPEETCNALKISGANQRVRLHRARAAVRQRLEEYFA